ncbi:hypothetical protein FM036_12935 [Nostoc sp. HG1]|nr:hypothetical protein [Nostoc sp. HG1]
MMFRRFFQSLTLVATIIIVSSNTSYSAPFTQKVVQEALSKGLENANQYRQPNGYMSLDDFKKAVYEGTQSFLENGGYSQDVKATTQSKIRDVLLGIGGLGVFGGGSTYTACTLVNDPVTNQACWDELNSRLSNNP